VDGAGEKGGLALYRELLECPGGLQAAVVAALRAPADLRAEQWQRKFLCHCSLPPELPGDFAKQLNSYRQPALAADVRAPAHVNQESGPAPSSQARRNGGAVTAASGQPPSPRQAGTPAAGGTAQLAEVTHRAVSLDAAAGSQPPERAATDRTAAAARAAPRARAATGLTAALNSPDLAISTKPSRLTPVRRPRAARPRAPRQLTAVLAGQAERRSCRGGVGKGGSRGGARWSPCGCGVCSVSRRPQDGCTARGRCSGAGARRRCSCGSRPG